MNRKILIFFFCFLAALFFSITINGQTKKESVIIIPLVYENGVWKSPVDSVKILPCKPPAKIWKASANNPRIVLKGENQKVIMDYNILDPRIILPEDPEGEYKLLDKVTYDLRLPFEEGIKNFEFFLDPIKSGEPTISLDLSKIVEEYKPTEAERRKAPCQEPEYVPDQRIGKK